MKLKIILMALLMLSSVMIAFSQSPQSFNYQAAVRDNTGTPIANQLVSLRISVLQGSATGSGVYSETHSAITNSFGIVNIQIGTGTILFGSFATISWGTAEFFIKIEIDATGGTSFQYMGTSQLVSVPYALYALKSQTTEQGTYTAGSGISIAGNVISNTAPSQWNTNGSNINYQGGSVGIGIAQPDNSSLLDVTSTSKGVLIPRMTKAQRNAIVSPACGLMVYNMDDKCLSIFNCTSWDDFTPSTFTCGQPFVDTRDGKIYQSVLIGSQCWMANNLNVGTRINWTQNQSNNSVYEKYCYNDLESNCDIYGGLYQWGEVVQYLNGASNNTSWNPVPTGIVTGICPSGWHLPTDAEWTTLSNYLGGDNISGGKMKETGYVHWSSPNTGATNSSGFTALGGGSVIGSGFHDLLISAPFWSASEVSSTYAWLQGLQYNTTIRARGNNWKGDGLGTRCVKN